MDDNWMIGQFGDEVELVVSTDFREDFEVKTPNVDLDEVLTPRSIDRDEDSDPDHSEPEDTIRSEIRCACSNHYYVGGGGCLGSAGVRKGRIFCDYCEYSGCWCLCSGCRTEHCSGLSRWCTCPCCRSDRDEIPSIKHGKRNQVVFIEEATSNWP